MTVQQSSSPNFADQIAQQQHAPVNFEKRSEFDSRHNVWRFAFQGNASEYFKIWIVNILLTIVTFSLYSPWAKVRRLKYFYGNSYLNRHKFEFTGDPWRIFIGRIIGLVIYGIFVAVTNFSPKYYLLVFIPFMLFIPWVIRSSLRFNARNSKYGNTRFQFVGNLKTAYAILIGGWILTVFSAGLLYPLVLYWYKRYQLDNLYVGQMPFRIHSSIGDFYKAIILPLILAIIFIGFMVSGIVGIIAGYKDGNTEESAYLAVVFFLGIYFFLFMALTPLDLLRKF
ncbi:MULTISPECIES: YjgN family protein [unclassified Acinetobacter]|uniref:YjgN family protein n=1 Tax=unclassified Acinetobacter TaxID=196816 RepID=UPI0035BA8BB9